MPENNISRRERDKAADLYEEFSPEQRRNELILNPEFRDAYNEITQAHRFFQLPQYYFERWRPLLGPVAHAVYEELRRKIYFNLQTGERRETVYIKQETIAEAIGVRDRKTVRKALVLLEEHAFIRRDHKHYVDPDSGRAYRGADKYTVYFEIPLTAEDAVDVLLLKTAKSAGVGKGKKSPLQVRARQSSSGVKGRKSPVQAREKIPSTYNTQRDTSNVTNVKGTQRRKEPRNRSGASLGASERSSRDRVAVRIGDQLKAMSSDVSTGVHPYLGYHRKLAAQYPEWVIEQALTATRDAKDERRLDTTPSQFFVGAIKRIARQNEISSESSRDSTSSPDFGTPCPTSGDPDRRPGPDHLADQVKKLASDKGMA